MCHAAYVKTSAVTDVVQNLAETLWPVPSRAGGRSVLGFIVS
jgi:hypothetical protein